MIQIFVTGGTFDKEYNYITGQLFFRETHLPAMLKRGRCNIPVQIETLMMLDSLEMTAAHRQLMTAKCRNCTVQRIVITHGTDTMTATAAFLAKQQLNNKTIVLTGAMIPYAFGDSSDGFFNLGNALAFAQCLPNGVYVAMNGQAYHWNQVQKNRATGFFEQV